MQHSILGPSAAERWINCTGSIKLAESLPPKDDTPNEYQLQGLVAHKLGEICLEEGLSPYHFINGGKVELDGKHYLVTAETAEAVATYTKYVHTREKELGVSANIEHRLDLSWVHPEMFGTSDATLVQTFGTLEVIDYKHGAGVAVSPEDNSQMKCYALGALGKGNYAMVTKVRLTIVQPRARQGKKIKYWETTPSELLKWGVETLSPAAKEAFDGSENLNKGSWCQWCRAKVICPKFQNESALSAFNSAPVGNKSNKGIAIPELPDLVQSEIIELYSKIPLIEERIKAVREYVEKEMKPRLTAGEDIPGLKLVKSRSTRQWADPEVAGKALYATLKEEAYEKKLRSPAQAEKVFKRVGLDFDTMRNHIVKKTSTKVVPDSDKRPAIKELDNASSDFLK